MFCLAVPQGTHENPKIVCRLRTHPAECSKLGKTQIIADAKRGVVRNTGFCGQIYRRLLHFGTRHLQARYDKQAASVSVPLTVGLLSQCSIFQKAAE